jgi:hypothetical protein
MHEACHKAVCFYFVSRSFLYVRTLFKECGKSMLEDGSSWRGAGDSGSLSSPAATLVPALPLLLVAARLTAESVALATEDADSVSDAAMDEGRGADGLGRT